MFLAGAHFGYRVCNMDVAERIDLASAGVLLVPAMDIYSRSLGLSHVKVKLDQHMTLMIALIGIWILAAETIKSIFVKCGQSKKNCPYPKLKTAIK